MEHIKSKVTYRKQKVRKKWKGRVFGYKRVASKFMIFVTGEKNFNPRFPDYLRQYKHIGLSFDIDPEHKSVYINGYYHYLSEKSFCKLMNDLKKLIKIYDNTRKQSGGK